VRINSQSQCLAGQPANLILRIVLVQVQPQRCCRWIAGCALNGNALARCCLRRLTVRRQYS
jgi:hypothetical protein